MAVFVVRIWLEESSAHQASPRWRATITDVLGERLRTVERVDDLLNFFVDRLSELGVPRRSVDG
jgi:hypothetical protein